LKSLAHYAMDHVALGIDLIESRDLRKVLLMQPRKLATRCQNAWSIHTAPILVEGVGARNCFEDSHAGQV